MAFNINAQVILSGPKNIRAVTQSIQQQLGNLNANVNLNIPKSAQQQLTNLGKATQNLAKNTNKLNNSAQTASRSVANVGKSTKQAANAMQVLGKETALTFKRFAAAGIVTGTVFRLTQAISEGVGKALEFERGLVRLQQITGKTNSQLSGLKRTVNDLATSLGQDANEILEIGQIFAQTGQSIREIQSSIRAVSRSSLAPTFGEMKQTAEGLVAALNQFGIAASQSEAILGSLNRVSKKFAVESDDLIAAIRRAGGVFALSAGEIEKPIDALNQFVGIFTAVRSTTRESAETVATGLRTIFSRIQRRGTIDTLKQLGINLTDANGKFIGLFQSFRLLSTELDRIVQKGDAITLSAITEELGGIRQIGKLIPAIRNFRKAEAAFAEAQAGAVEGLGSDVERGLTPLIKTFEQVSARFQNLIRTISESATFQALAKTAAGLANAFLSVSETLTPLLPLILKFATFKLSRGAASFFQGFTSGFGRAGIGGVGNTIGTALSGGGGSGGSARQSQAATSLSNAVTKLSQVTSINTTALNNLTQAVRNLTTALPRSFGIGGGGLGRGAARGPRRGFNRGGFVPGTGNRDTVPAMLTPGEFVINKSATQAFGAGNLASINKYATGGKVGQIIEPFNMSVLNGLNDQTRRFSDGPSIKSIRNEGGPVAARELEAAFAKVSRGPVNIDEELAELKALRIAGRDGGGSNALNTRTNEKLRSRIANKIKGRGNNKKLKEFKNTDDAIAFVQGAELESAGIDSLLDGSFLNAPTSNATGIKQSFKDTFDTLLRSKQTGLPKLLSQGLGGVGSKIASLPVALDRILDKTAIGSLEGQLFEGFVKLATQNFLAEGEGDRVSPLFDVTSGELVRYKELFGSSFDFPSEIKNSFSESNIASTFAKAAKQFGASAIKFDPNAVEKFSKFATGGMASGTDTVPALLTPGEFVVNKKSAQAFGYGNLKDINRYAYGGVVRSNKHNYGPRSATQDTSIAGVSGGAGFQTLAFVIPDLLFTLPLLTESLNQQSEGVEGAGTQLTFALVSLATSALLVAGSLREIGKGSIAAGFKGLFKGFGKFFNPIRKVNVPSNIAAVGPPVEKLRLALTGLIGPLTIFAGAGAVALFALDKAAKKTAEQLREFGLSNLEDSIKSATEALSDLANSTSLDAALIRKANIRSSEAVNQFGLSVETSRQARATEEGTILSQAGAFFSDIGSGIGDFFSGLNLPLLTGGETGIERTQRKTRESFAREGELIVPSLEKFTKELAEASQTAFETVQAQLAKSIISGSKNAEEAAKTIDTILSQIDTSTGKSTLESLGNLKNALKGFGDVGQAAADQISKNLAIQFQTGLNTLVQGLGDSGEQLAAIVSKADLVNAFGDPQRLAAARLEIQRLINSLGPEASRTLSGPFNDLVNNVIDLGVNSAKAALEQEKLNALLSESQKRISAVVTSVERLADVFGQASGNIERIVGNLSSQIDSLVSGEANFNLQETINPFENLDILGDASGFKDAIGKGFAVINSIGGDATEGITLGLMGAVDVAANFDQIIKTLIASADNLSAGMDGAIVNVTELEGVLVDVLDDFSPDFAASELGEQFIKKFFAGLEEGREGDQPIPIDKIREALADGSDILEQFGEDVGNTVEALGKAFEEARKIEQLAIDRLSQERKISEAIRSLDFKELDIRRRVGEVTGDRTGTLAEAQADLRSRVGALTGGITDPNRILQNLTGDRARLGELEEKRRRGGVLDEDEAKEFVDLQGNIADNTQALKELSEDTTQLAAVQNRIAELQARQDASRQGLVGLLGRLGGVQDRLRNARGPEDVRAAFQEAQQIRAQFRTIQKLQTGEQLTLSEAAAVLGGEFDQILKDLGQDPDALKVAVNKGFDLAVPAVRDALGQLNVQLPEGAFGDVNLGDQIDEQKDIAKKLGDSQIAANDALKANLDAGTAFIVAATEAITNQDAEGPDNVQANLELATKKILELKDGTIILNNAFGALTQSVLESATEFAAGDFRGPVATRGQFQGQRIPEFFERADGTGSVLSVDELRQLRERGLDPSEVRRERERQIEERFGIEGFAGASIEDQRQAIRSLRLESGLEVAQPTTSALPAEAREELLREFARSQGVATTRVDRVTGPRGGTITTRSEVPVKDIVDRLVEKLIRQGKTEEQALQTIAQATGLSAEILRQEQGLNSFSVFDNQANKKLDEQNKLTEKETSKADKRFPPRSAFGRTASGPVSITAGGAGSSGGTEADKLQASMNNLRLTMQELERRAVDEFARNAAAVPFFGAMNLGGGPSSLGAAGDTTAGLSTAMQDALARIREENRDPAGVDGLAGKTAQELQKMSVAMFEARRELIAFQKGLTDAADVTDQEVRDSIMRDLTPENRIRKVTNEALEANMIQQGQFAGLQANQLQFRADQIRGDKALGLQSDEERLAAEVAFRDQASRRGIVSGRVGAQSSLAIRIRQLESIEQSFDASEARRRAGIDDSANVRPRQNGFGANASQMVDIEKPSGVATLFGGFNQARALIQAEEDEKALREKAGKEAGLDRPLTEKELRLKIAEARRRDANLGTANRNSEAALSPERLAARREKIVELNEKLSTPLGQTSQSPFFKRLRQQRKNLLGTPELQQEAVASVKGLVGKGKNIAGSVKSSVPGLLEGLGNIIGGGGAAVGGGAAGLLGGLFGGGAAGPAGGGMTPEQIEYLRRKEAILKGTGGGTSGGIKDAANIKGAMQQAYGGRLPSGAVPTAAAGGGAPAGGGGVAGPDVAMQNLANALNGIRDGINLNIGEVNVTITNTGELANSIKQAVIDAIGGGVNDNSLTTNETSLLNTTSTA